MSEDWLHIYRWEQMVGHPKIEGYRARTELKHIYVRPKIVGHNKILNIAKAYPQFLSKDHLST